MSFFVLLAGDVVAVRGRSIDESRRGWMQLLLKKSWDVLLAGGMVEVRGQMVV